MEYAVRVATAGEETAVTSAFDALPSAPLKRPNTYELIADSIIELIATHQLRPGDPLPPERILTARFGAGRSSVREALRVLESKGLIIGDRGGFVVADVHAALSSAFDLVVRLTQAKVRDLMALRRILEVENARQAAHRADHDNVQRLIKANQHWEAALADARNSRPDVRAAADADLQLHALIAEAAGNETIQAVMQAMRQVNEHTYHTAIAIPEVRDVVADQHRLIIEAIRNGDADGAAAAMHAHVAHVEERLGDLLNRPIYKD
jgi:DNA-binding FadR family transcriptional regulator